MIMTDTLDLFSGIGVIIDDAFARDDKDLIKTIKESFETKYIPIISYPGLPDDKVIPHLKSASFIILDWNLTETPTVPDELIKDIIEFLKEVNNYAFLPIFIFSNESEEEIILKLEENNLYDRNKTNYIFVKHKEDIKAAENLFAEIEAFIKSSPSIYVLKEWEHSLAKAKHDLFIDFYNIYGKWPSILQKSYKNDGVDVDYELNGFIFKNLYARTSKINFDNEILTTEGDGISKQELRKLLESERFLTNDKISAKPALGDVFKIEENFFINIRPDCDIIRGDLNQVELYCLKGTVINEQLINSPEENCISFKFGELGEKINNCFVSFIDDGKIIEFKLRDIKLKKWKDISDKRIGRLLPPYITKLQQKYSFYIQRQGLPAIPDQAILTDDALN